MSPTRDDIDVRIREARPADAEPIADVHVAAIREQGSEAYDERQVEAWLANVHPERYPLGEPDFHVVVAERADNVVGFGLLERDPSDVDEPAVGKIGAVYVRPDHVREGVGGAILDALESAARDSDLETIVLTASKNAIDFYRRRGYEGVETVVLEMRADVPLESLRMRRELA